MGLRLKRLTLVVAVIALAGGALQFDRHGVLGWDV